MKEEKQGVIADIIFHNQENGYTIAVFETEDEQFTAVGNLPSCHKGRSYLLRGQWKIHPTYGEQFAISSFEEVMPSTEEGIEEFLSSGVLKGIGKKTAAAIVARFGNETFAVIENQPHRLTEIPGIGEDVYKRQVFKRALSELKSGSSSGPLNLFSMKMCIRDRP